MDSNTGPQAASAGELLLADYQTAFSSLAMSQAAKYEAERSEHELMNQLTAMGGNSYLTPGAFNQGLLSIEEADLTHGSLDAHIKKVQAAQLESLSIVQLQELAAKDKAAYTRRKIIITVRDVQQLPIESAWTDKYNGLRTGPVKTARISGVIDEIALDKNVLIIRPTWRRKLFNSGLTYYLIYVIDPETLQPMVDFTVF